MKRGSCSMKRWKNYRHKEIRRLEHFLNLQLLNGLLLDITWLLTFSPATLLSSGGLRIKLREVLIIMNSRLSLGILPSGSHSTAKNSYNKQLKNLRLLVIIFD